MLEVTLGDAVLDQLAAFGAYDEDADDVEDEDDGTA